ncbi:MAG TPA: SLBB domain-containing protein [Terracidiphilus sp.]|nr:SLBB domain-containing protein [Terracidiphilus sp.]
MNRHPNRKWIEPSAIFRLLYGTGVLMFVPLLAAQVLPAPTAVPGEGSLPGSTTGVTDTPSSSIPANVVLSASQIISILQERPQVVVELKQLVADNAPQGTPIQPESITDEMLFNQISASPELRRTITLFLRARGYVSDEDLARDMFTGEQFDTDALHHDPLTRDQLDTAGKLAASSDRADVLSADGLPRRSRQQLDGAATRSGDFNRAANQSSAEPNAPNITDQPKVLREPSPYNLMSLRDLYAQIPDTPEHLTRFGSEVFTHRNHSEMTSISGSVPLGVPIGPEYVVGPGDGLTISMWGGISQTLTRVIAPDGHVTLPDAGDIQVAGLTLAKSQEVIQAALKHQYRDVQISVSLARLRTILVYVVGDAQRPGAYEISSLATPLDALYAAGGPSAIGSLRVLKHLRGDQQLSTFDLYAFLLRGTRGHDHLQEGDTVVVPPAGPQVAVWGEVKRPAIYELTDATSLSAVLEVAGGMTVAASLEHISVEHIDANQHRETITVRPPAADDPQSYLKAISEFEVHDGDRVHIAPITPFSERVVYLEGHVVRPGRQPYRDGMRLNDVLRSYDDLLPEPAAKAEIIRLVPPDLHVQTIDFNVADAMIGNGNIPLQPFDTIRILGRYDLDAPKVEIRGEVLRPGSYPLSDGLTAAQLVRIAGGFKRDALVDTADLISYRVMNGTKVEAERADVRIGDAVNQGDASADRTLKGGDVLTIHQITGWNDIGSSIVIEGEVAHPGSYGFKEGERLSDLLRRAGGFRETAYPAGAILIREQVRELEEKSRVELIRQIETSAEAARLSSNVVNVEQAGRAQLIQQQQEQILSRLKNQPATGRLVIRITLDIDAWAGSAADIEVRSGDVLRIPKRPGFVLVSGQVYNASAITFMPGRSAGWYLERAGGPTSVANRREIFVVRANGSVVGRRSGDWFDRDVLSTRMEPGDVVVVPQKIVGASLMWRNLLSTAQIASSIAITAAVAGL